MLPPFRQIKFEAKALMMPSMPVWFKATLLLIALQFATEMIVTQFGGFLGRPLLGAVGQGSDDLVTGVTREGDQLLLLVRLDVLGLLVGIASSLEAARRFLLFGGLFFLLLAPLKMGLLEIFWKAFRGQELHFADLLAWYKEPARIGKAVVVQFVVSVVSRIAALITIAPGYALYYVIYSGSYIPAGQSGLIAALSIVAMTLLFVGLLAGFFCYAALLPLSYCLAAQPGYSLSQVFRRGFGSIRGFAKRFFYFRLSLLPWHFVSIMSYGVAELFVLPYLTFASLQFLQYAAVEREKDLPEPA